LRRGAGIVSRLLASYFKEAKESPLMNDDLPVQMYNTHDRSTGTIHALGKKELSS